MLATTQSAGAALTTSNEKKMIGVSDRLQKEAIAKSMLKQTFKSVFKLHGALDIDVPVIAPVTDQATIFISLRQQQLSLDRRLSNNSDENEQVSSMDDKLHFLEIDTPTGVVKFSD